MTQTLNPEAVTLQRIKSGKLVEGLEHMSPTYLEGIKRILTVSADTELISAPAYFRAAQDAPSLNAFGTAISIVQDELAHAHIAYRLLEDLGVDKDWLIYQRAAGEWKYPYAFDVPLDSWYELVVANAFYDQAGYELLSDVYHSTTFGPWKRALAKVDKEETFHLRHGQQWIRRLAPDPVERQKLQRAADWMFMLTVEWFGLPDSEKRHTEQLDYGFKGRTNDGLRQAWMAKVVPFCEEMGLRVPAHAEGDRFVLEVPFPARFDASEKRWLYEEGQIGWDEVLRRWKARGPMNAEYVGCIATWLERGHMIERLWAALGEVEDPEIPVPVVDMGLIVSVEYEPERKTAQLRITYTAMGCPAMDMIQDDIRARLLREDGVEHVEIDVVWDPVWTERRLSQQARSRMRDLGLAV